MPPETLGRKSSSNSEQNAVLSVKKDVTLGSGKAPYPGAIAIDGNLTEALLAEIGASDSFVAADLRLVPASPGKAERLRPLLGHPRATLYVNLEEAGLITGVDCATAHDGAAALLEAGARRAVVTDGHGEAVDATADGAVSATPPVVEARRITGAGDTFMAAHIAAELAGQARDAALQAAVMAAAHYVAGHDHG